MQLKISDYRVRKMLEKLTISSNTSHYSKCQQSLYLKILNPKNPTSSLFSKLNLKIGSTFSYYLQMRITTINTIKQTKNRVKYFKKQSSYYQFNLLC